MKDIILAIRHYHQTLYKTGPVGELAEALLQVMWKRRKDIDDLTSVIALSMSEGMKNYPEDLKQRVLDQVKSPAFKEFLKEELSQ